MKGSFIVESPLIPIASKSKHFAEEFPGKLGELSGLALNLNNGPTIAVALMESASLIPKQRRIFLSYRRAESTKVALQLYAALSALQYDAFLDTHEILPGEHFQEVLWQKLCDSGVMVYLDTPKYFTSRWTTAEFSRATSNKPLGVTDRVAKRTVAQRENHQR